MADSDSSTYVFTVGPESCYDRGIAKYGREFKKIGKRPWGYPGGFALRTVEDAHRLIEEHCKQDEWAVYRLDADWDQDTVPSKKGWWHALVNDSVIVEKVASKGL